MAVLPLRIQVRRDQDSLFNAQNPLLLEGEIAFSIDKNLVKIGDGVNTWQELPYLTDEVVAILDLLTSGDDVDGSIASLIKTETDRAIAAETALQANIDTNQEYVEQQITTDMWFFATQDDFPTAETNHGRVVHSHADAAIFFAHAGAWHQVPTSPDLDASIAQLELAIIDETNRASLAESVLTGDLADEITRATEAEAGLGDLVAAETAARTDADDALQTAIDDEVTRATEAEADLGDLVAAETAARTDADTALQTAIDDEVARATAAEALLAPLESPDFSGQPTAPVAWKSDPNSPDYVEGYPHSAIATVEDVTYTAGVLDQVKADAADLTLLDGRVEAVELTLDGNLVGVDGTENTAIAAKANYCYAALTATGGIEDQIDEKADLSAAPFTGPVSVAGTFTTSTNVAEFGGPIVAQGSVDAQAGLTVSAGNLVVTDDAQFQGDIFAEDGNFTAGIQVGEQVLARSAALNDNAAGPDDPTVIPFVAGSVEEVLTREGLAMALRPAGGAAGDLPNNHGDKGMIAGPHDDNAAATGAGLAAGTLYYTTTGEVRVVV